MSRTWKADVLIGNPADLAKALNTYESEGWKVFSVMPYVESHVTHLGAWTIVSHQEKTVAYRTTIWGDLSIKSDEELKQYTSTLFRLTEKENPTEGDHQAIERLGAAIEAYESKHHPFPKP